VNIHPTAIIHPSVQLGANVTVGPYAVIDGPAVIGDGCTIMAHAIISGRVVMGKNNAVHYSAVIGGEPQDFAFKPEVQSGVIIGEGNRIREHVTIHRGTAEGSNTVVGDNCFLMAGVHLAHNVVLADHVVLANNALLGGHVQIAERTFVGGACVFHQHMRVGSHVICQGTSGYSKDIPPFCIGAGRNGVVGLNVIGLRRSGLDAATRADIKRAFDLLYRSERNVSQAREAAQAETWTAQGQAFWDFVGAVKKNGLCGWFGSRGGGGVAEVE
jgi:UDP-N-acetylglucosamine acyltransferase